MILVITTVFVIVVSILVVGFMSRNTSQTMSAQQQIKHIQAEALLDGAMWRAQTAFEQSNALPPDYAVTVENTTYTVNFTNGTANSDTAFTTPFSAKISY